MAHRSTTDKSVNLFDPLVFVGWGVLLVQCTCFSVCLCLASAGALFLWVTQGSGQLHMLPLHVVI